MNEKKTHGSTGFEPGLNFSQVERTAHYYCTIDPAYRTNSQFLRGFFLLIMSENHQRMTSAHSYTLVYSFNQHPCLQQIQPVSNNKSNNQFQSGQQCRYVLYVTIQKCISPTRLHLCQAQCCKLLMWYHVHRTWPHRKQRCENLVGVKCLLKSNRGVPDAFLYDF